MLRMTPNLLPPLAAQPMTTPYRPATRAAAAAAAAAHRRFLERNHKLTPCSRTISENLWMKTSFQQEKKKNFLRTML